MLRVNPYCEMAPGSKLTITVRDEKNVQCSFQCVDKDAQLVEKLLEDTALKQYTPWRSRNLNKVTDTKQGFTYWTKTRAKLFLQNLREVLTKQECPQEEEEDEGNEDPLAANHDEVAALTASVCNMNLDWSNRKAPVRSTGGLVQSVCDTMVAPIVSNGTRLPDFTTLSEVGAGNAAAIYKKLCGSHSVGHFKEQIGYDHVVTIYDANKWEPEKDIYTSTVGKYQGIKFTNIKDKSSILHISTHLPHRSGRSKARTALAKLVEDQSGDCDAIAVVGDFNASANEINGFLLNTRCAFDGNVATTDTGTQKDNIVVWDDNIFTQRKLMTKMKSHFSHFPMAAMFTNRDI